MMSVSVNVQRIGVYKKRGDNTAEIGVLPRVLNEDPKRYGLLKEEDQMDLKKGCVGLKDEGYGDLFHSFFDYTMKTSKRGISLEEAIGAKIVTTRRTLRLIANKAFFRCPFAMLAIRKKGVIFLCEANSENDCPNADLFEGHKFDQYMTLDDNGQPHDEYAPVSNAECTRAVLRTSLKQFTKEIKVVYTAVIDAQDKDGNFVEIKSSKLDIKTWIQKKSLANYLQAYFGAMSHIIHGETDENKVVKKVTKLAVNSLPNMDVFWNPQRCFSTVFKTLETIQSRLTIDDTSFVIRSDDRNLHFEMSNESDCKFMNPDFLHHFD